MNSFGELIRQIRLKNRYPLRHIADNLGIDLAVLSKIEKGNRKASRELVKKLAAFYNLDENDLLLPWLSDKVIYEIENEELALNALKTAEELVIYNKNKNTDTAAMVKLIRSFFVKDGRVLEAWIFGSIARKEGKPKSDLDLMVHFSEDKKISLFDFADISFQLGKLLNRKIDLVEIDCIKPFAWETVKNDLIKIYG